MFCGISSVLQQATSNNVLKNVFDPEKMSIKNMVIENTNTWTPGYYGDGNG